MSSIKNIEPRSWDRLRLAHLLKQFSKRRILVVGDVGVDRYTVGHVSRISPEAPVPVVAVAEEKLKLGLAANVADNIRALGARSELVGLVGEDRAAQDLKGLLKKIGVSFVGLVADGSRRTILKERVVSDGQQLIRVDYEDLLPLKKNVESQLVSRVSKLLSKADAVIVQDYAKGMIESSFVQAIFRLARKHRKIAAVDPNAGTPIEVYRGTSVIKPNFKESEALSGIKIRDDASLLKAGQAILRKTGARSVVMTRGKDGMAIFERGMRGCTVIPTFAREVYDVSGAGDTAIAVITLALASGGSLVDAAILGNLASSVEVGKRGTATVTPEEVLEAMERMG